MHKFITKFICLCFALFLFVGTAKSQTTLSIAITAGSNPSCAGSSVTFTATAKGGTCTYSYKWYKNGTVISGETNSTYTTTSLSDGDAISAEQTATSKGCSDVTSNSITVKINPKPVLTNSLTTSVCSGSSVSIPLTANLASTFTWAAINNSNVTGETTTTQSSSTITNNLNTTSNGQTVTYAVIPTAIINGCKGDTQNVVVTVNPYVAINLIADATTSTAQTVLLDTTYFYNCVQGIDDDINLLNNTITSDVKSFTYDWGDNTTLDNLNSSHTYNALGYYNLTATLTTNQGCVYSSNYKCVLTNTPGGSLVSPGGTINCAPFSLTFGVDGVANNLQGTEYLINFGDGDSTFYTQATIPSQVTHTYTITSCGKNNSGTDSNSYSTSMQILNPCSSLITPIPVYVSSPPIANFSMTSSSICVNNTITFTDSSFSGGIINVRGVTHTCSNNTKRYWVITPSLGWNTSNNVGSDKNKPQDVNSWSSGDSIITVNFTNSGTYTVELFEGNTCNISTSTQTITVFAPPIMTQPTNQSICSGNSTNETILQSNTPNTTYSWTASASSANISGFTASGTGNLPSEIITTTDIIAGTVTYTITPTADGCVGNAVTCTITVTPTPYVTTSPLAQAVCSGYTTTAIGLTSNISSATYSWSTVATQGISGFTANGTSNTIPASTIQTNQQVSGTITYNISLTANGCPGTPSQYIVTVNPTPTKPTINGNTTLCSGIPLNLTANSITPNVTYNWTIPNGSNASPNGATVIDNIASTSDDGSYSVTATESTCTSPATSTTVTVNPTPSVPGVTSPISYCQNATPSVLTATGTSGDNFKWYNGAGTALPNAPTPTTSTTGSTNYYVSQINPTTKCESDSALITVTVNPIPTFTATGITTQGCKLANGSISITGLNANSSYSIFNGTDSITSISGQSSYSIQGLTAGSYKISISSNGCSSDTASVTISDPGAPNAPIISTTSPVTLCSGNTLGLSVSNPVAGDTYTWAGAGVNASNQTGTSLNIQNVTTADSGKYSVTVTENSCVSNPSYIQVNINETPSSVAINGNASPYCSGTSISLTASSFINSSGTVSYQWTKPDKSTISGDTFSIANCNTGQSTQYSVVATLGSCPSQPVYATITIDSTPHITATPNNTNACLSNTGSITISGVPSGNNYTINYKDNTGLAQNIPNQSSVNNTLTIPNLVAGSYTNITIFNGVCTSNIIPSITISDPNHPKVPAISGTTPTKICSGNNLNLSVSNPVSGITYTWAGAGVSSSNNTGSSITIQSVPTNDSGVYTVSADSSGCLSPADSIDVTVDSTPALPTITANASACSGDSIVLSATTSTPGNISYLWTLVPSTSFSYHQDTTLTKVTASQTGPYGVVATATYAGITCSSAQASQTITVNPTPVISSSSSTSPGQCATATGSITLNGLTANTSYTINYSYNNGTNQTFDTTANGSGTITLPRLAKGSYSNVFVTSTAGCNSNSVGAFVLVDPGNPATPSITGDSLICSQDSLILTTPSVSGATYSWSFNGVQVGNSDTLKLPNTSTNQNGAYSLFITVNNCQSLAAMKTVLIDSTPATPTITAQPNPICTNGSFTLQASTISSGAVKYSWTGPDKFVCFSADTTINNIVAAYAGNYYAKATSTINGCVSDSGMLFVEVDVTPKITGYDSINPSQCATNTGSITLHGLISDSVYTVNYNYNGKDTSYSLTGDASGNVTLPTLFAGDYTNITVTKKGCPSNAIDSVRLKDPNPPATPTIMAASTYLCSGLNDTLTASTITTGTPTNPLTYQWSGPNSFAYTGSTTYLNSIATLDSGSYSVIAILASCKSASATIYVKVDSTPQQPIIAPTGALCSGNNLVLQGSDNSSGTLNYKWTGPAAFTSGVSDTTLKGVTQNNSGWYYLSVTSPTGLHCESTTDSVNVLIRIALTQAKIGRKNVVFCNFLPSTNDTINLTGNLDTSRHFEYGHWDILSSPNGSNPIISDTSNPNASIKFDVSGNYTLEWSIGNDVHCQETRDTMQIEVVDKPAINAAITTPNTVVCQGNPVTLSIDSASIKGNIEKWQYMLPYNSGIWQDTAVKGYSITFPITIDTFSVRVLVIAKDTINCGGAATASDSIQIVVAPPSKAGTAFGADTVCQTSNSGTIRDTGNIGTIVTWQQSTDSINFANIAGSGGNTFAFNNLVQTTWFRAAIKSGACDTITGNSVRITVLPPVTLSVAGNSVTLCADTTFQLSANMPDSIEMGTWTFQTGSSTATITNLHSPTTTITKMQPNTTYNLTWTISNGFCTPSSSNVTITNDGPLLNTIDTATLTVCNGVTVSVTGDVPQGGNGMYSYQWQTLNKQDSTWANIPNATSQSYSFTGDTTIVLRRQVTSNPCFNTSLTKTVIVQPPLANNFITGTNQACINTSPGLLTGSVPTGADGNFLYQWQASTDTVNIGWVNISGADTQNYTPPVLNLNDTNYYHRIVTTNLCKGSQADTSGTFVVFVRPNAVANWAITTDTSCAPFSINNSAVNPVLDTITNGSYSWYANDSLYGSSTTINPGYTLIPAYDSVMIKMVAVSRYGCKNDSISSLFYTPPSPKTKFKVSDSSDCGPLADTLTNITPTLGYFQYSWNFGYDSTATSTLAQPGVVIFPPNPLNKDTIYTVTLTGFNQCDTITYSRNIKVRSKAKAIFTPSATFGCSPLTDTFINTSRGDSTTYLWEFGDGASKLAKDTLPLAHTYHTGSQDTFTVKLIAENYCGNDTGQYAIVVAAGTIKLRITVNGNELTGCNPSTVHFINTTQGASTFDWDFGDGNQATTKQSPYNLDTIAHKYDSIGVFNVTVTASNNCTDTTGFETIKVLSTPKAAFVATPDTVCIGHPISFTNESDATTGLIWNFGDGGSSLVTNPQYAYAKAGNYDVQLIAERQHPSLNTCMDTAIRQVTVIPSLPGFIAVTDSVSACVPFTVTFTNTYASSSKTCTWNFGDSTTGTGNTITHTFTKVGVYSVVMNAVDTGGCTYTGTKQITANGPVGSFTYDHGIVCGGTPVNFVATVTGTDSLQWNFGDDVLMTTLPNTPVYYTYPQSGKFLPIVTLYSAKGTCMVPLIGTDTITIDYVKAGFSTSDLKVCDTTTVNFIDTSNAYLGLKSWAWNFGNSKSSTIQNPKQVFLTSNTWPIQLIVKSNSGCSDTANVPTFIKVNNTPKADILADTMGCENQPLINIAAITSVDTVTYFDWQFSNGTTGNTDTINAYFATTGHYKTKLIIGTAYGCYDTVGASVVIYPTPEVVTTPNFTLCKGQSAFINTTGATKYEWTPSTGLSCNTCPNPVANPIVTTNYVVAGFNSFGCADRDTLLITVPQPFTLTTSGNDTMCIGDKPNQLAAFGASNYSWSPSIGLNATNIATPLANPSLTTEYRVIGTDDYNCFADTSYLVVAVGTYPTVTLGPELILSTGTTVTLNPVFTYPTDAAGPISKYVWSPSTDLSCDNCPNPVATVENDICYTLTATNIYGCSTNTDTLCIKAFCKNTQVFIANAFTPDGDGVNDKLVVQGKGIKVVKSFRIFSRWGQVVFERDNFPANDPSYGWDGTIKGVPASPDVYVYTCEVMCENDVVFEYKGNTAIIK